MHVARHSRRCPGVAARSRLVCCTHATRFAFPPLIRWSYTRPHAETIKSVPCFEYCTDLLRREMTWKPRRDQTGQSSQHLSYSGSEAVSFGTEMQREHGGHKRPTVTYHSCAILTACALCLSSASCELYHAVVIVDKMEQPNVLS